MSKPSYLLAVLQNRQHKAKYVLFSQLLPTDVLHMNFGIPINLMETLITPGPFSYT